MKRKFLEDLGLEKEAIDKIMTENGTDIETAKADYEALKQDRDSMAAQVTERDKQLEKLKKSGGDNEELQKQITDLQAENKAVKEKYETDMKDLKLSAAIKVAVAGSSHDTDIVSGLMDKSKLILSEDGKVSGLDEQLKAIRETKPFLFKEATQGGTPEGKPSNAASGGYKPRAGKTNDSGFGKGIAEALNKSSEAAENPFAKAWG